MKEGTAYGVAIGMYAAVVLYYGYKMFDRKLSALRSDIVWDIRKAQTPQNTGVVH